MFVMPRFADHAVLFDLDGTLLDTAADLALAANRMLAELGFAARSEHEIRRFVGKGIPNLVQRCLNEGRAKTPGQMQDESVLALATQVFRRHYADTNGEQTVVYPGVRETLDALQQRGLPLACVTNKAEAFTLPLLDRTGLRSAFRVVVSGDTLPVKKPDPAVLLYACRHLGVNPGAALMVGDSIHDAEAARAAGISVVLVRYGYSGDHPVDTIECDGLVSSVAELLPQILPC